MTAEAPPSHTAEPGPAEAAGKRHDLRSGRAEPTAISVAPANRQSGWIRESDHQASPDSPVSALAKRAQALGPVCRLSGSREGDKLCWKGWNATCRGESGLRNPLKCPQAPLIPVSSPVGWMRPELGAASSRLNQLWEVPCPETASWGPRQAGGRRGRIRFQAAGACPSAFSPRRDSAPLLGGGKGEGGERGWAAGSAEPPG